jgi:hypothetical protein
MRVASLTDKRAICLALRRWLHQTSLAGYCGTKGGVSDHEGAGLRGGQVIEAQCRHLGPAELASGGEPSMTRDHVAVAIDQDRDIEVDSLDAFAKLPDLLLAVPACVIWIRFELVDRPVDDQHPRRRARARVLH